MTAFAQVIADSTLRSHAERKWIDIPDEPRNSFQFAPYRCTRPVALPDIRASTSALPDVVEVALDRVLETTRRHGEGNRFRGRC